MLLEIKKTAGLGALWVPKSCEVTFPFVLGSTVQEDQEDQGGRQRVGIHLPPSSFLPLCLPNFTVPAFFAGPAPWRLHQMFLGLTFAP